MLVEELVASQEALADMTRGAFCLGGGLGLPSYHKQYAPKCKVCQARAALRLKKLEAVMEEK